MTDEVTVQEHLVARRISVIDEAGRPRIALGVDEEGGFAFVRMLHTDGSPKAIMETDRDGNPWFVLLDSGGFMRMSIAIDADGQTELCIRDRSNGDIPRIVLKVVPDFEPDPGDEFETFYGGAGVVVHGPDGAERASLYVANDSDSD